MTKPTENELFELLLRSQPDFIEPMLDKVNGEYKHTFIAAQFEVWKARAELADKEKAELQAQVNELREGFTQLTALKFSTASHIQKLDAVNKIAEQALAKTAPQCLIQHDNEAIDKVLNLYSPDDTADDYIDKIRALKG